MEVWRTGVENFVELNNSTTTYGIKQEIKDVIAGGYVLAWKDCGRTNDNVKKESYTLKVYYVDDGGQEQTIFGRNFDISSKLEWTDRLLSFQITDDNMKNRPNSSSPIYIAFIPLGDHNSYGDLIDEVKLLPIEIEITHVDPLAQGMSNTSVLRDEIVNLRVKIPPLNNQDWKVRLDVAPDTMRVSDLAAPKSSTVRKDVLMFDYAQPHKGLYTSTTAESDGTESKGHSPKHPGNKAIFDTTILPAANTGELTLHATFNKEGTIQVRVRSCDAKGNNDGRIDVLSQDISVNTVLPDGKPRLRQYAEGNDFGQHDANGYGLTNQYCNKYDADFNQTSGDWIDWGYGFTDEEDYYTFAKAGTPGVSLIAELHDAELLKAQAFKETQMSPDKASERPGPNGTVVHSGNKHDIMQLERGGSETSAMNHGTRKSFNASATKIKVTGERFVPKNVNVEAHYEPAAEHDVYLIDVTKKGINPAPGPNYGYPRLWYQTNTPEPASSATEQEDIKWALRDLIMKSQTVQIMKIKISGGVELYGDDPQQLSFAETYKAYCSTDPNYATGVLQFKYEGRQGSRFGWPRLATKTARR